MKCLIRSLPLPLALLAGCAAPLQPVRDPASPEMPPPPSQESESPLEQLGKYLGTNGIRLRRRGGGAHELPQPAQFSAVKAAGRPNSQVSVDAALNWQADFLQFSQSTDYSLLFEMHKNTAFPAKQESYLFGLQTTSRLNESEDTQLLLDTTLAWKTDKYTERGLFAKAMVTAMMPDLGAGKLQEEEGFAWRWLPQVGLLYENASSVIGNRNIPRGTHGDALSIVATVGADLYPFTATVDRRLRLHAEFSYWGMMVESGGFRRASDNEHQFRSVIDYALDQSRSVFVGIEYGSGGNPEIGLRHEDYFMFHLSLLAGGR